MTRHLAKLLEMLWYTSIGLFLGLHAGTILAVVETFDSSRKIDATPSLMPYADAQFAETHNEVVAGFIAQNIFKNNGSVALILLGIALIALIAYPLLIKLSGVAAIGNRVISMLRTGLLLVCVVLMLVGASHMTNMNKKWPSLYELDAPQGQLDKRRAAFDASHRTSESLVGSAWFLAALALVISPWCRRVADTPSKAMIKEEQ